LIGTILTRVNGDSALITLNRPKAMNALSLQLLKDLLSTVQRLEKNKKIRFVEITGAGKAFSAGMDLKEMRNAKPIDARKRSLLAEKITTLMEGSAKTYIANINGHCLGGGLELTLACDYRITGKIASFGLPETTLGITQGFGATVRLPNIIGKARAKELMLTGEIFTAKKALHMGLVHTLAGNPAKEIDKLKDLLRLNGSTAMAKIKKLTTATLKKELAKERDIFAKRFGTKEQQEGMNAFFEKRKPKW